jgi:transposase
MIDYETFVQIKTHQREHLGAAQIAKVLQMDIRTVRKWMRIERFRPRTAVARPSKLDPYRARIRMLLERHPYSAVQLYQAMKKEGYEGGLSILKDYVRRVRPTAPKAFLTLTFAPGECAQVDWGHCGSIDVGQSVRRLSVFVMTLGYSRMMYIEFTVSQRMETWLGCHVRAFEYFGGVPQRVMVDNLKSAVLDHPPGGPTRFHPRYLELAAHYGFSPIACGVRKPHEKGRVERSVGYVKKNLLAGLESCTLAVLQAQGRSWLDEVANPRVHRSTRRQPVAMFATEEKPALSSLSLNAFDTGVPVPVRATRQFRVHYDGNRYSVPSEHAGNVLSLRAYDDRLLLYHDHQLIAEHLRSYDRAQDFKEPDHERTLLNQRKRARKQHIHQRFIALSPAAESFYQHLQTRRLNPQVHLRKIVALLDLYPQDQVVQALEDACQFQAYSSEYVLNILQQRTRKRPEIGPLHVPHKQDLLELELPEADCSQYTLQHEQIEPETKKNTEDTSNG